MTSVARHPLHHLRELQRGIAHRHVANGLAAFESSPHLLEADRQPLARDLHAGTAQGCARPDAGDEPDGAFTADRQALDLGSVVHPRDVGDGAALDKDHTIEALADFNHRMAVDKPYSLKVWLEQDEILVRQKG